MAIAGDYTGITEFLNRDLFLPQRTQRLKNLTADFADFQRFFETLERFLHLIYSGFIFRRRNIKTEPKILFEWHVPQELMTYAAKKKFRGWLKLIPLTIIAAILLEMCLLVPIIFVLKKCGPEGTDLIPEFVKLFVFAIPAILLIPIIAIIWEQISLRWCPKWAKVPYKITAENLISNSNKFPKIPWAKTMFIGVTPPDQLDKYQCLNLFYKKRKLSFPLPDSTLADEIIKFVSEKSKIEKDDSLIEPIVITRKQKTFIFCLIGTYILLPFFIAFFLISPLISKQAAGIFLLIWFYVGLFLGPGTVSMLIFYRPLYFRRADLQREGKGYNLVLAFIIISIGFVWFLYSVFTEIFNLLK